MTGTAGATLQSRNGETAASWTKHADRRTATPYSPRPAGSARPGPRWARSTTPPRCRPAPTTRSRRTSTSRRTWPTTWLGCWAGWTRRNANGLLRPLRAGQPDAGSSTGSSTARGPALGQSGVQAAHRGHDVPAGAGPDRDQHPGARRRRARSSRSPTARITAAGTGRRRAGLRRLGVDHRDRHDRHAPRQLPGQPTRGRREGHQPRRLARRRPAHRRPARSPGTPAPRRRSTGSTTSRRSARQVADDFSIELWFKSTQGIGTGTQWSNGAGLVDGDGRRRRQRLRHLAALGRQGGGRDRNARRLDRLDARGGYNNGAWHHVVFTRTKATGALALYVDGGPPGRPPAPARRR